MYRIGLLTLAGLSLVFAIQRNTVPLQAEDAKASPAESMPPQAGMGIMVGELTDHSALVQVRLTQGNQLADGDLAGCTGIVEFTLKSADGGPQRLQHVTAAPENDFIARAAFTGLKPGSRYVCQSRIGVDSHSLRNGPTATFQTHPGATGSEEVSFVVVTGMNYAKFHGDNRIDRELHKKNNNTPLPEGYQKPDKALGYPALASILKLKPNFFVGTGDNVYYDTPTKPRAQTIPEMRRKWHEQFSQPRYRDMFAAVPTYWEVDDHDYRRDDCDNTGDYLPTPTDAKAMMLEQLPYGPMGDHRVKTYRTHRISRDLQIWLVENRLYRSPNSLPDGPAKSIWGSEQKAWLKRTLADSDATFKVLISPTPMIGPDDKRKTDNHCDIGGFQHERDEFFDWLIETGLAKQNFYLVCGDRHWQYHSISPQGIEEFSCGALVDANARLGRNPGDPASTDPEALIKQPYTQQTASGGFLHLKVTPAADQPATLTFRFCDEHAELLHETKTVASRRQT